MLLIDAVCICTELTCSVVGSLGVVETSAGLLLFHNVVRKDDRDFVFRTVSRRNLDDGHEEIYQHILVKIDAAPFNALLAKIISLDSSDRLAPF